MKKTFLMAVDLGTSYIKVGVYDTNSNCVVLTNEPVKERCPKPGVYIQYGEEIFKSVLLCIRKATEQLGDRSLNIEAIALTGQMAGFMGVDEDWNDITTWSCSLDGRYLPFVEQIMGKYADLILDQSGTNCPVMAPKINWFKSEFPEQSKRIVKYLMVSSYVLGRLGNVPIEEVTINRSYLEWTGLADIRNDRWSENICRELDVNINYLPNIVNANVICGKLSSNMAIECGLKSGIPLVSGAGDKAAGCLGAAVVEPGDMILEASSYAGMSCCVKEYRPDYENRRLEVIPSAISGEFYSHYYIAGSGITLDWFLRNFDTENSKINEAFKAMEKKIEKVAPGSDGVLAIGMLGGRAMPLDGNMRGMWMNYNWSHKKEHFYHSLIESFSYEFALTLNRLDELYPEYSIKNVKIIGGGAKSKVWTQMNADISRRNYKTLSREDNALWGTAIIAGNAVGIFNDMKETARKYIQVSEVYEPDLDAYEKYQKYMNIYNKYTNSFHKYFKELQDVVQS